MPGRYVGKGRVPPRRRYYTGAGTTGTSRGRATTPVSKVTRTHDPTAAGQPRRWSYTGAAVSRGGNQTWAQYDIGQEMARRYGNVDVANYNAYSRARLTGAPVGTPAQSGYYGNASTYARLMARDQQQLAGYRPPTAWNMAPTAEEIRRSLEINNQLYPADPELTHVTGTLEYPGGVPKDKYKIPSGKRNKEYKDKMIFNDYGGYGGYSYPDYGGGGYTPTQSYRAQYGGKVQGAYQGPQAQPMIRATSADLRRPFAIQQNPARWMQLLTTWRV